MIKLLKWLKPKQRFYPMLALGMLLQFIISRHAVLTKADFVILSVACALSFIGGLQ